MMIIVDSITTDNQIFSWVTQFSATEFGAYPPPPTKTDATQERSSMLKNKEPQGRITKFHHISVILRENNSHTKYDNQG